MDFGSNLDVKCVIVIKVWDAFLSEAASNDHPQHPKASIDLYLMRSFSFCMVMCPI